MPRSHPVPPMEVMRTNEVLEYLGIKRTALYNRILYRRFPPATGRDRHGKYWHVEVVKDYKEKMIAFGKKNWEPSVVT